MKCKGGDLQKRKRSIERGLGVDRKSLEAVLDVDGVIRGTGTPVVQPAGDQDDVCKQVVLLVVGDVEQAFLKGDSQRKTMNSMAEEAYQVKREIGDELEANVFERASGILGCDGHMPTNSVQVRDDLLVRERVRLIKDKVVEVNALGRHDKR